MDCSTSWDSNEYMLENVQCDMNAVTFGIQRGYYILKLIPLRCFRFLHTHDGGQVTPLSEIPDPF